MSFFSKLRAKFRKSTRKSTQARRQFEPLEQRRVLTSYLFVDFGDNFNAVGPDRVLTTTVAELRDVADAQLDVGLNPIPDTVIHGAQLTDPDSGANFADGDTVSLTRFTFTSQERARVIAQLQRAYLPFDVTVVDLTTTGQVLADGRTVAAAASMADIVTTLRDNNTTSKDAYVIVARPEIGPDEENPNDDDGSFEYNSISASGTILGEMSDLAAGTNAHDDLALVFELDAAAIAREVGHTYGLRNSVPDPAPDGISGQLHSSEVMSGLSTDKSWYFTNFPMVEGDGNTDNDTLLARNGQQTPADQLFNDANVGANAAYHYITGTGAHDIITITRNGGNADITIEAFANADYTGAIEVPGNVVNGTVYSFTVDLTRDFLIYAGLGNDRIVIDGDFGNLIDIKGMSGTDSVQLLNSAENSITYTPGTNTAVNIDGESDVRGSLEFGTTTVNFADFEGASTAGVEDIATLTVTGSAGQDWFRIQGITGHQGTLYGFVGTVNMADLIYDDVTTLNVNTGADTDSLWLEFDEGNPIPTTLNYDGGTGTNSLYFKEELSGGTVLAGGTATGWLNVTESSTDNNIGSVAFGDTSVIGTRTVNYDNLTTIFDETPVVNFVKNATAGADTLNVTTQGSTRINGSTVTSLQIVSATNITVNTLGDDDVVNVTGLNKSITLNGGAGTNTVTKTANVNFSLVDAALTSTDGVTFSLTNFQSANLAGGAGNNTFTISGWTGTGTIDGVGGTADKIISTKNSNVTLTNTNITAGDGTNMTLANVEVADLAGGAGSNTFTVTGWTRTGTVNGLGGNDTFVSAKNVNYTAGDTLVSSSDGMNFTLSSIETINLTAGGNSNTFTITPSATTVFNLAGLGGSLGDRLNVNFTGTVRSQLVYTGVPHGTGYWKFGNRKNINFVGVELLDFGGNVTAVKSGGTLTLTGDSLNNGVSVTKGSGSTVVVTGLGSKVNGAAAAVTFTGVISVVANMNDGNDYIHFNNLNLYSVIVNGGNGNDRLQMGSGFIPNYDDVNSVNEAIALGSMNIRGSLRFTDNIGLDSALLTRTFGTANWDFSTGDMDDRIEGSSTASNSFAINAGSGHDTVNLDRHSASLMTTVDGGAGNDSLILTNGEFDGDVNVLGNDGQDLVIVGMSAILEFLLIDAGIGDDTVIVGGNTISKDLTIRSQAGADTVHIGKHQNLTHASNTVRKLFLETGSENDVVTLGPNSFNGFFGELGAGNDDLSFDAVNTITVKGTLDGGFGTDRVHKTGTPNLTYASVTFY